uniref:Retrotransposon gag domain-containing protein n=1 Tax=Tanacetum cinerariifolium TaxID=118510 RepID=A0A699HCJ5_TANCI|nr:hypothetical protein [Tanacetum cinerariifolium]
MQRQLGSPPIFAEQFELKHSLINMMNANQFFGLEKENPYDHIRWFNKITSTIKYKDVLKSAIKLMLFTFSLAGATRQWLEKEPSLSILTWEDLVSKFINEFFLPSRTTNLRNEISNFQQRFDESFHEAWDRYKDLLRACPHHGFTELHQLDTFYNALNSADQDSLNSVAGGNLLERPKLTHAVNQQTSAVTTAMTAILKQFQATPPPASVKAVEDICVTCGGAHPYYQCLAAVGNTFLKLRDNIQGYVAAAAVNYSQGNFVYRPPGVANQIQPPGFAQPNAKNNQNRFGQPQGYNRGNNFNPKQSYQAPTQPNQVVPLSELEKVKKMNEANMKAMQTQINNVKNESGSLPSNTIANPKAELKAITTRSGIVLDGPSVHIPLLFINPEEDERVEETLTDQDLAEDPLHPNIPYPSKMYKQKQQEKDEVQIYKFWQIFKQLHINITLADALILILKYQKMLKALLSKKEKLLELANTPLNENCSAVILKKLLEKLRDPEKFLISCGFSELKCKALADLGASINLMPLFVWKKLGLPELISTRMTLELANRAICTPSPLYLGKTFLTDCSCLINVHGEEMILCDGDERLTLNMRHDTSSYSNQPQKESINLINVFNDSSEDFLEKLFSTNHQSGNFTFSSHPELASPKVKDDVFDPEGGNVLPEKLLDLDSSKDLHPPHNVNPLSGSTTFSSSSPNQLLEEFADELALITFPSGNDDLPFDIESNLKEIEYLLYHDPIKDIDSILKDSIDQSNLANLNDNLVDTLPEMFTNKHALDYSSPPLYDEYNDDIFKVESCTDYVYNDPFDSKGEKIKESKLSIDELDLPSDFLPPSKYDSFLSEDFSKGDTLSSTNNEDKKLAISHASLILENFDPPLYELPCFKKVPRSKILLVFSSENEEKVFKLGIHTSKEVHSSHIPELSHQGYKVFKIN